MNSAEIYDPSTGHWSLTNDLNDKRALHGASILKDGKVLVIAGVTENMKYVTSTEVYDPSTNKWTITSKEAVGGLFVKTVLLRDGRVLIAGGDFLDPEPLIRGSTNSAAVYDPNSRHWMSLDNMHLARSNHTLTVLNDGRVLAVGGIDDYTTNTVEFYNL